MLTLTQTNKPYGVVRATVFTILVKDKVNLVCF